MVATDAYTHAGTLRLLEGEREFTVDRSLAPDPGAPPPDVVVVVGAADPGAVTPWRDRLAGTAGFILEVSGREVLLPSLRLALRRGGPPGRRSAKAPLQRAPLATWPGRRVHPVAIRTILDAPWFARVGEPLALPSMALAVVRCPPEDRADARLLEALAESMNQLSGPMSVHRPDAFMRWNDVAKEARSVVTQVRPVIDGTAATRGVPPFGADIAADIVLFACIAGAFSHTGHRCSFAQELLDVLIAGHLPTAWLGDWPEGALGVW